MDTAGRAVRYGLVLILCISARGAQLLSAQTSSSKTSVAPTPILRLSLRASIPIPPNLRILGATAASGDGFIFWGSDKAWSAKIDGSVSPICQDHEIKVTAAFHYGPSASVAMFDARERTVFRATGATACGPWFRLNHPDGTILATVWNNGLLVILERTSARILRLTAWDTLGRRVATGSFRPKWREPVRSEDLYLSRTDIGVVVGSHRYPGWWALWQNGLRVESAGLVDEALMSATTLVSRAKLYMSPVIHSDDLFIQSVTELSSMRRFLVAYDALGNLRRIGPAKMQASVISSIPGDSLFVGLVREPSAALQLYARIR